MWFTTDHIYHFMFWDIWRKQMLNKWTRKAETRKAEFLAAGQACKAVLWPTPALKEGTSDSSGSSAERTLTSVSTGTPEQINKDRFSEKNRKNFKKRLAERLSRSFNLIPLKTTLNGSSAASVMSVLRFTGKHNIQNKGVAHHSPHSRRQALHHQVLYTFTAEPLHKSFSAASCCSRALSVTPALDDSPTFPRAADGALTICAQTEVGIKFFTHLTLCQSLVRNWSCTIWVRLLQLQE